MATPRPPFWPRATALFAVALAFRLALLAVALGWSRQPLDTFLVRSDAPSYVALARVLLGEGRPETVWHERVYWGWPLAFAPLGRALPLVGACVAAGVLWASLVPPLFYALTRHFRLAALLTVFPPTWLMHSCMGMSEAVYLAALLLGAWAMLSGRTALSGGAVALAVLVRPTAVFVAAGLALVLVRRRRWGALAGWSALCLIGPAATVALNVRYYGEWDRQARLHGAPINVPPEALRALAPDGQTRTYFCAPFEALVKTPLVLPTPKWKVAFVYAHVLAVLLATALAVWHARRSELDLVIGVWALLNTCFIVSTGPYWGFHSFDRYCVWGLPAYLYAARGLLPRREAFMRSLAAAGPAAAPW